MRPVPDPERRRSRGAHATTAFCARAARVQIGGVGTSPRAGATGGIEAVPLAMANFLVRFRKGSWQGSSGMATYRRRKGGYPTPPDPPPPIQTRGGRPDPVLVCDTPKPPPFSSPEL